MLSISILYLVVDPRLESSSAHGSTANVLVYILNEDNNSTGLNGAKPGCAAGSPFGICRATRRDLQGISDRSLWKRYANFAKRPAADLPLNFSLVGLRPVDLHSLRRLGGGDSLSADVRGQSLTWQPFLLFNHFMPS